MSDALVLFEIVGDVAVMTLNDAARMNPMSERLQQGVLDGLQRVRDDRSIRAMVLTGNGKGFCVGADLADFNRRAADLAPGETLGGYVGDMMSRMGNQLAQGLASLPVPVVSAVNGAAAGGGFGIALAADMVLAARSAYFYLPFVPALGVVPDMGATWALTRHIGRARAIGLTLTGQKLPAQKAADWGMIWDCVDDDRLLPEAMALAQQLAALPAHAIEETRALFAAGDKNNFADQLELERLRQTELIDGPSFAEGVQAFVQKRRAVFGGR